ncbi:MAG: serine--tRNA ligase [Candidatus Hodarchaeaceae archaeon]|nr:serine--tRNA ligase [Candidatus Hodarchaeaceae archaeon]
MLDIKFVRKNPLAVKDDLVKRGDLAKVKWVDDLLEYDRNWRKFTLEANKLRERQNRITEEIARLKKEGRDATEKLKEAKAIPSKIKQTERAALEFKEKVDYILLRLPNLMHESVPAGKDENDNVEVRRWGKIPEFDFVPKDHIDLALNLGLIDLERAAKVAGARFYYLKGELVQLNYAIVKFALDFIAGKGFALFQPPYMLKRKPLEGAVALSDFEDTIYKVENEDLYLLATSEHALLALHMDETLDGKDLPLRYSGVSPCFRKEAGTHGRDTKGIFRVHQFEKIEQFTFCKPENSWDEHEGLIANAEEIFQKMELPYRVVNVCSGDLGTVAAKKYDLEVWLPGQGKYREVASCSNCTSYQAVRSNIRYRDRPGEPAKFVHTLNSTLVATERVLIAILENYQQKDGSISVPEVLAPYMGIEKIGPK